MAAEQIREELFQLQDPVYRDFQRKLIPTVKPETFIGVRTPELRKLAKQLVKTGEISDFLRDLPHPYFDENQLHAFAVSEIRDYDTCMAEVNRFLPYVDNWAVCDSLRVKAFAKHPGRALPYIEKWIESDRAYTVRFAILCLMNYYLTEHFEERYLDMVAAVESEEYYVRMMVAWYFATALAKQYKCTIRVIEDGRLEKWTHNKAIQKAVESYRVSDEHKAYLKTLKY